MIESLGGGEIKEKLMIKKLNDLSQTYIELVKISWGVTVGSETDEQRILTKKNYQQKMDTVMEQVGNNFPNENSCLVAKFAFLFGTEVFDNNQREQLSQMIKKGEDKFPVLEEIDKAIGSVRGECFNFYTQKSDKDKLSLFIPYFDNPLANIILETEVNRLRVDQNPRNIKNSVKANFPVINSELNSGFEIRFEK